MKKNINNTRPENVRELNLDSAELFAAHASKEPYVLEFLNILFSIPPREKMLLFMIARCFDLNAALQASTGSQSSAADLRGD